MRTAAQVRRGVAVVGVAPLVAVVVGVGSAGAATAPTVHVTFDPSASRTTTATVSDGSASVSVVAVGRNGGTVATVSDAAPWGYVGRTPAFDARSTAPRGVLRITGGSTDPLSPLTSRFTFGADVKLDAAPTASHVSGSTDNGDNVVQRGLYGEASQYKIQVDRRQPSCRVKGSSGAVMVTSPISLAAGTWYRLRCTRDASTVTLQVVQLDSAGAAVRTTSTAKNGATGSLRAPSWSEPMSVGGKLTSTGTIARQSDQFNGRVDNVVLTIG